MLNWFRRKNPASYIKGHGAGGHFAKYAPPDNRNKLLSSTERMEKEIYLLVGPTLVKMKLEALKREGMNSYMGFKMLMLEIDGFPVPPKDQKETAESFESRNHAPSTEEQQALLRSTLENFGIRGKISQVTESYVLGHLKVLKLRERVWERR